MWVIHGPFDGKEPDVLPPPKSKLLKTGITYTLGRKDQDLVIRDGKISREHMRFYVGRCSEENAADPDFVPTLNVEVVSQGKNVGRHLERPNTGQKYTLNPGVPFQLENNDKVSVTSSLSVTVQWQEVCCYAHPDEGLPLSRKACASLGIHIVPTLHASITHHLAPTYTLSPEIAVSLISVASIVKPAWLVEALKLGEGSPSPLERNFLLPSTVGSYRPTFSPTLPSPLKTLAKWEQNEARVGLFRDHRFVIVGEKGREVSSVMREVVKRGEGEYECFSVHGGRRAFHQVLAKGQSKGRSLVVVANESAIVPAVGRDGWQELIEEAESFGLRILRQEKILEAIVHADTSNLEATSLEEESQSPDIVLNTHPDEPSIPPETVYESSLRETSAPRPRLTRRATSRAASRLPSPASTAEPPVSEEPAPRRKLVRRAGKPRAPILGIDDPSIDLDDLMLLGPSAASSSQATAPAPTSKSSEDVVPTSGRPRLKRRAGTRMTPNPYGLPEELLMPEVQEPPLKRFKALFDESDPDRITQSAGQSEGAMGMGSQASAAGESLTQVETGTTQAQPWSRAEDLAQLAVVREEEEESTSVAPSQSVGADIPDRGLKRKSQAIDEDVEMDEEIGHRAKRRAIETVNAVPSSTSQPPAKPVSGMASEPDSQATQHRLGQKASGAVPGIPDKDEAFLKAVASTKRGKKTEDTFDREFNNLRISKPELDKDEAHKQWAILEDFGDDGDVRGNFMTIVEMDVPRKDIEARAARTATGRADWEGKPDFKKFKKKSAPARHHAVELYADEEGDYGVGSQYWKGSAQPKSQIRSQLQSQSGPSQPQSSQTQKPMSETRTQKKNNGKAVVLDDSDEEFGFSQTLRRTTTQRKPPSTQRQTAPTQRTRTRGKTQPLFLGSDEDEDDPERMDTEKPIDDPIIDDDSDDEETLRSAARTQTSTTRPARAAASKRQAPPIIVDDDSDDEATFKGFGARKKGRRR